MISEESTLTDVAFEVCTALDQVGFTAVLTGGGAATYYSAEAYLSQDLDFILTLCGGPGEERLSELGFKRTGDFYVHDKSVFSLDFPRGPLAVGDEIIERWRTIRRSKQILHVLTPTDSCRDRLASFLFWNDLRGLEQALIVYKA